MNRLLLQVFCFFCISISLFANEYFDTSAGIMFEFYHSYMAPLKSPVSQCQFTPSCSEYSKQAIKEFGIVKGMAMTTDRLMRCSGGHASYEDYPFYKQKFIDKPQNNSLFGNGKLWALGFSATDSILPSPNKDSIFDFAKSLFDKGELQLSKLELLRIDFNNKDENIKLKVNLLLGMNEFITNKSIKSYDYISNIPAIDNKYHTKYFLLNYLVSDFQDLNAYAINLSQKHYDPNYTILYDKLLVYSHYKNSEIDSSLSRLEMLKLNSKFTAADTIAQYIKLNFQYRLKSPLLAGVLSTVIPGAGYMYAGRIKEGASALIVNGLLGAGIYSLFKSGNTGSGILTSMIAFPFYFGNIVGAVNAAESVNIKHHQIVLSNLRNSLGISFYFSAEQLRSFWE